MLTEQISSNSDLRALLPAEMEHIFLSINEPAYRSKQLFQALHRKGAINTDDISNLKKATRDYLANNFELKNLDQSFVKVSEDGTRKYQFTTHDGHIIESVFIPHAAKLGRHSLCISSQVGCAMDCGFCLTGKMGFVRNLTPGEMVGQVRVLASTLDAA